MQHLIESLREDLASFVEQRESLTLVLWAKAPTDTVFVLKLLESLEEMSERDVFILFTEDCYEPARYVDSLMAACDFDIDAGNEAIARGEGGEGAVAWDSLPAACFEERLGTQGRMRVLVEHMRRYYPDVAHRLIFSFLPTGSSSFERYVEFVRELVPEEGGYEPWMAGVRYLVLDSQRAPRLVPDFAKRTSNEVLVRPVDFSSDGLAQALVAQADDASGDRNDRMLAQVQVGAIDHGLKRYPEALQRYGLAYGHYLREKNSPMQGICLLFCGYTLEQMGQLEPAKERFRQALELGLSEDPQCRQIVVNAFLALGAVHQHEQDWPAAADYFAGAAFVAKAMQNFYVVADASERAGLCRLAMNEVDTAFELWDAAVSVGSQVEYWGRVVSVLEHRVEVEERMGQSEAAKDHREALGDARLRAHAQGQESAEAAASAGVQA